MQAPVDDRVELVIDTNKVQHTKYITRDQDELTETDRQTRLQHMKVYN